MNPLAHWQIVFEDFHRLWGRRAAGPRYTEAERLAWAQLLELLQFQADRDHYFAWTRALK